MSNEHQKVAHAMRNVIIDMSGIVGFGLVIGGLAMWSIPLSMVVAGAMLLGLSIWGAR
jgi:hypothetical protein